MGELLQLADFQVPKPKEQGDGQAIQEQQERTAERAVLTMNKFSSEAGEVDSLHIKPENFIVLTKKEEESIVFKVFNEDLVKGEHLSIEVKREDVEIADRELKEGYIKRGYKGRLVTIPVTARYSDNSLNPEKTIQIKITARTRTLRGRFLYPRITCEIKGDNDPFIERIIKEHLLTLVRALLQQRVLFKN